MIVDSIIVGAVVTSAAAYLVWHFMPKSRKKGNCAATCGNCAAKAPVRRP